MNAGLTVLNRSSNAGKLIIGVDDAPENLLLLRAVVKSAGYTFMPAASGAECLSIIMRANPRLILLDIEMPGMDGFETCRRLRAHQELNAVPILFLTGRKTVDDFERGISAGGNDFLLKPFERDKLLSRISIWANRRLLPDTAATKRA